MRLSGFIKFRYGLFLAVLLFSAALLSGCSDSVIAGIEPKMPGFPASGLTGESTGSQRSAGISLEISEKEKQELLEKTVRYQTEGNVYQADSYEVIKLKKGDIVFGMLPGQSVFYTDRATFDSGRGSYIKMYELLQIRPHPVYGYRTKAGKYEVQEDIHVTAGTCRANCEISVDGQTEYLGEGGGCQYVIFEFEQKLKLVEEIALQE